VNILKSYFIAVIARIGGFKKSVLSDEWVAGATSGLGLAGLGATQMMSLLGISVVGHSSGASILTGAGGYIAGTYGSAGLLVFFTLPVSLMVFLPLFVFGVYLRFLRKKPTC
jgi:uncharacterized paraquat-inducible protein A